MNEELKQLIEDAAKLLGYEFGWGACDNDGSLCCYIWVLKQVSRWFNPLDPERGDLMKVAEAAELTIDYRNCAVSTDIDIELSGRDYWDFTKGDHTSKVLAVLRAASAVYKSRGGV